MGNEDVKDLVEKSTYILQTIRVICDKKGQAEALGVLQHALIRLFNACSKDKEDYETLVEGFTFLAKNVDDIEGNENNPKSMQ